MASADDDLPFVEGIELAVEMDRPDLVEALIEALHEAIPPLSLTSYDPRWHEREERDA